MFEGYRETLDNLSGMATATSSYRNPPLTVASAAVAIMATQNLDAHAVGTEAGLGKRNLESDGSGLEREEFHRAEDGGGEDCQDKMGRRACGNREVLPRTGHLAAIMDGTR